MLFGLLGKSLAHSFSAGFFNQKFKDLGLNHQYKNFEIDSIEKCVEIFALKNLQGLNVTVPYKEQIIPYLDTLSQEAQKIGAVNVITIEKNQRIGYNTDVYGFEKLIEPFHLAIRDQVVVLGAGGAAKAVNYVLRHKGITPVTVVRSPQQGQISFEDFKDFDFSTLRMLIQTTPVGLNPEECLPITYEKLNRHHIVVDLIYNPSPTLFLKNAQHQGAKIVNGSLMLYQQAEKAWEIWQKSF